MYFFIYEGGREGGGGEASDLGDMSESDVKKNLNKITFRPYPVTIRSPQLNTCN